MVMNVVLHQGCCIRGGKAERLLLVLPHFAAWWQQVVSQRILSPALVSPPCCQPHGCPCTSGCPPPPLASPPLLLHGFVEPTVEPCSSAAVTLRMPSIFRSRDLSSVRIGPCQPQLSWDLEIQ